MGIRTYTAIERNCRSSFHSMRPPNASRLALRTDRPSLNSIMRRASLWRPAWARSVLFAKHGASYEPS
jgi:hypothetical protein